MPAGLATSHDDPGDVSLTIERLLGDPPIYGDVPEQIAVAPDGSMVAFHTSPVDDPMATLLVTMRMDGSERRVCLDTRQLEAAHAAASEEMIRLEQRTYRASSKPPLFSAWVPDSARLLALFGGDLFVVDVAGGSPRRLTDRGDVLPFSFHASATHVAFARERRIAVLPLAGGEARTFGGDDISDTVSYGVAEFVAQEEMRRFAGAWWSPDGTRLAYTRVDEAAVASSPRLIVDTKAAVLREERFPRAGTANADVQLHVAAMRGGAPVRVDLGPDTDVYLFDVRWAPSAAMLYVQVQTRDQRRLDLRAVDPETGASRVIASETSDTYVDLERTFVPLRDGRLLWGATRDGWRHLYLLAADGTPIRQVTSGPWRVANPAAMAPVDFSPIVGVDEERGCLYVVASIDTPIEQHLHRIDFERPAPPVRLTDEPGWWAVHMARDRPRGFVAVHSSTDTPPRTSLHDVDGRRVAWIAENRLDASHPYWPYRGRMPTHDFGTLAADDGLAMHYTIVKPPGFDASRRHPAIVKVYGGPNVQSVRREWRNRSDQVFTDAGYVLFQLDGRGTTNRSERFEHANRGDLGPVAVADQSRGLAFLKTLPYVDPERIGITGVSFGGYMTVRLLAEPGTGLRAGAAAGVPAAFDFYDTHYTERFLGTPQANPDGYRRSDLLNHVRALEGELLLAHGLADDNVGLDNFTALVAALQDAGKLFDVAVYPGAGHVFGKAATAHLVAMQLRFFERHLRDAH